MKRTFHSMRWLAIAAFASLVVPAQSQTASQPITLVAGWNSIWLQVEPVYPAGDPKAGQAKAPEDVFTDPAIDIVSTPKPLAGSAEFFASDPGSLEDVTSFNKEEWLQWKRTDATGSNNLASVFGNRPYLIHTTAAVTIAAPGITGKVRFFRPKWTPDRYNLLGFGLDGTPTFAEFFSAAGATGLGTAIHPTDKIFTLNASGAWVKVSPSQAMVSDRAYWIFSNGPSNYMGPVAIDFDGASSTGSLNFAGPGDAVKVGAELLDLEELSFTNYGSAAVTPTVTFSAPDALLDFFRVTPDPSTAAYVRGNKFPSVFVSIPAQQTFTLSLGAKRTFVDDAVHTGLYRIQTSPKGASFYIPLKAVRSEVDRSVIASGGTPISTSAGLWVGDVVVNSASSIVVNGSPIQPTAGTAPVRIILHSDAAGTVRLLSQVTMMQTKTADPATPGTPVLVTDPTKIPFFEGIKTRNGKRTGVRLESISYDMPRSANAWSGPDLVTFPNRPTALKEIYDLSVPMAGTIGQVVTGTFTLDPFHRSNPLRHVYHQDLTKGPKITRTFKLEFDSDQLLSDRLDASFTDTIQGLIKDTLILKGNVELRRVSPVATLQGQ